jgi:hypothetical protein
MSSFVYGVGLNNVGSYQVSGHPFCATGSLSTSGVTITFPDVTKEIVILNRDAGVDDMEVYFHVDSPAANRYVIQAGQQQTFGVKCAQIYLSSSVTVDYTLYASLTGIPADRMFEISGSGITS